MLYIFNCTIRWFDLTLWNDHHVKAGSHLSPYKVITMLSTIFLMLCVTSPLVVYSITKDLYFLILSSYFTRLPTSLPSAKYPFVFCFYESIFLLFCFVNGVFLLLGPIIIIIILWARHFFWKIVETLWALVMLPSPDRIYNASGRILGAVSIWTFIRNWDDLRLGHM